MSEKEHIHDHDHDHERGHSRLSSFHVHSSNAPEAIVRAMAITILFMLIEGFGGWIAHSLALLSDAAHQFTDVGAMLLSLFAIWISRRPSTQKMSFGYHRAEILGALASGLIIWALAAVLVYGAIERLRHPVQVHGEIVFVIAILGLIANFLCMRILHHAQDDDMNAKGAYLHMLADALGSVGAIVAGAVLIFTHWNPIDPIITIFFAVLMLASSWELVAEAVGILMESTPSGVDSEAVRQDLQTISGVREAHDLHIWTVSSGRLALSVHLVAEGAGGNQEMLRAVNQMLEANYGIIHTTIQIEQPESFQLDRCYDCRPPARKAR